MVTLRHLYKLPLRQLEGFVGSIFSLLKLDLEVPEFSRVSKRMQGSIPLIKEVSEPKDTTQSKNKSRHLVIDSTGLKLYGEQEWLETKYGKNYSRKIWRKLHIGIDGEGYIVAKILTNHRTDDRKIMPKILAQAKEEMEVSELLADGGYDSHKSYEICDQNKIKVLIRPPKNATISRKKGKNYLRNKTVEYIKQKGFHAWRVKNNFGRSYRVENTFYRLKTIFGRKLKSRDPENQIQESNLICHLLNKMTDLGMPKTTIAA